MLEKSVKEVKLIEIEAACWLMPKQCGYIWWGGGLHAHIITKLIFWKVEESYMY